MTIDHLHQFPELFEVDIQPGSFNSSLRSLVAFKEGQLMAHLIGMTKVPTKTWTSVQCGLGQSDHLELNSTLVYANHSCSPNAIVDVSSIDSSEWHFRALKDISPGDNLTFFYPSTEWDMTQAFDCACRETNCLKRIQGAKYLTRKQMEARGFVNPHIAHLMEQRDMNYKSPSLNL
ncbi:galactose-proton symport protein, putative [Rhizoctonia solani AG-3 Rhs1AP]|uniref:Galactose-proton symport protein, putative n=1 Tax=Rhizoctonia solani AG-3 Rhs1AP TaxID=1086054 RepID=A0A0A1UK76_9AGAM|nr:galactose-proton symport protein, putative [Rhizoctonia solani AG-3 Rhs1AP]